MANDNLEKQIKQTQSEKESLEAKIAEGETKRRGKPLPIILCVLFGLTSLALGFLSWNTTKTIKWQKHELMVYENEYKHWLDTMIPNYQKTIDSLETVITKLNRLAATPSFRETELEKELTKANSTIESLKKENKKLQRGLDAAIRNISDPKIIYDTVKIPPKYN
jgi:hypothetical protein